MSKLLTVANIVKKYTNPNIEHAYKKYVTNFNVSPIKKFVMFNVVKGRRQFYLPDSLIDKQNKGDPRRIKRWLKSYGVKTDIQSYYHYKFINFDSKKFIACGENLFKHDNIYLNKEKCYDEYKINDIIIRNKINCLIILTDNGSIDDKILLAKINQLKNHIQEQKFDCFVATLTSTGKKLADETNFSNHINSLIEYNGTANLLIQNNVNNSKDKIDCVLHIKDSLVTNFFLKITNKAKLEDFET